MNKYDVLEFISQREDGEMSAENEDLVHIANVIRRATTQCSTDEAESGTCDDYGINRNEKRIQNVGQKTMRDGFR